MMADIEGLRKELKKTLHKMMIQDTQIWLIKVLLRLRLATWDIYNFATKQADLRTTIKSLDWKTINCALRTKLKDIRQTLNGEKKRKAKLEMNLKTNFRSERDNTKQMMISWKKYIRKERKERLKIFKKKVEHLKKKQREKERVKCTKQEAQTFPPQVSDGV